MAAWKYEGFEPTEHVDERWLTEWVEYGWTNANGLLNYLQKHAGFLDWCDENEKEDE